MNVLMAFSVVMLVVMITFASMNQLAINVAMKMVPIASAAMLTF